MNAIMDIAENTLRRFANSDNRLPVNQCLALALSLARQVRGRHNEGTWHGDIRLETVEFSDRNGVRLLEPLGARVFGGDEHCELETCPPELFCEEEVRLTLDIREATQQLRKAGLPLDVRRIDVYQIGVLLCQLLTGESLRQYAESARLKATIPADAREILDRTLGFDTSDRVQTCNALCDLIESVHRRLTPLDAACAETPANRKDSLETNGSQIVQAELLESDIPCERLAHFRLVKQIGRGGMGDVFLAHDEKLDRRVAVKILRQDLASDDSFVGRFQTEVDVIKQLPHPNLLPLYYAGAENGRRFYAMRFIDGPSLASRLQDSPLSPEEAIDFALQCLSALAVAHDEKLIHRDIKPSNVLLETATGRAYLVDFGLVRRVDESQGLTRTGVVVGSFQYLSPEQARGDRQIDHRADLYSFGVMFYQMLAGQLPFAADSEVGWIFQHVNEPPLLLEKLVPNLQPELYALVNELLAKKPEDRPADCRAVIERLQPLQEPAARASQFVSELSSVLLHVELLPLPTLVLPARGVQGAWERIRDGAATMIRRQTPAWVEQWQSDEQQVEAAIAQLERRKRRFQTLQAEGHQLLRDLKRQYQRNDPTVERQIRDISEKVANVDLQVAQVKAQLIKLTSSRDALFARLRQAERGTSRRRRTTALGISAAAILTSLAIGIPLYRSLNQPVAAVLDPKPSPPNPKPLFPPPEPKQVVIPPPKTAAIQAKTAEAVLAVGGKLQVMANGARVRVASASELPAASYEIVSVSLAQCQGVDLALMTLIGQTASVEEIDLFGTGLVDTDITRLQHLPNLRVLHCSNLPATGSCLAEFGNLPSLKMLSFGGAFDGNNLDHLARFRNLEHVFLGWTKLSDEHLKHVPELPKVRHVLLNRTNISGEGLQYLSRWPAIDDLSLSVTKLTDEGLAYLPTFPRLKKLDLSENDLSDASVSTLSRYRALQSLNLKKTKFTADGLAQLRAALPGCVIEHD